MQTLALIMIILIGIGTCWGIYKIMEDEEAQRRLTRCGLMSYTPKDKLQLELKEWVDCEHKRLQGGDPWNLKLKLKL